MATMQKANRLLTVRDEDVAHYISRGYDEVNDQGDVVRSGQFITTDKAAAARVAELEAKLAEAESYAENADKTIDQLTARVAELETAKKKGKQKDEEPPTE